MPLWPKSGLRISSTLAVTKKMSYKYPPVFDGTSKPYDRYIEELKAWCIVTDLNKAKQGLAVALSLSENDASGAR